MIEARETSLLNPSEIIVSERLRGVDEAWVEAIAASIEQKGQDTPIQVRRNGGGKLHLVAGAHRLEACRWIGIEVRAEIIECTELEARLTEVDENLFRHELGMLDRAVFLAERKAIYEEMHPEIKKGAKNQHTKNLLTDIMSFSKETALRIGLTDRTIRRAIHIAEKIPADLRKRLAGTKIAEKQADLLYLAGLEPATQRKAVALVVGGAAASLKAAVADIEGTAKPEPSPEERQFNKLIGAWSRSGSKARTQFIAHLRSLGELGGD